MRLEIAFSGESTRRPRCGLSLERVRPGSPVSMISTSAGPTVITYHWHDGRPFIHTRPVCLCSTLAVPARERAYLGGMIARRDPGKGWLWEPRVVEVSACGLTALDVAMKDHRTLLGAKLVLRREGAKLNSRLVVELKGFEPPEALAAPLDVLAFVHELWGQYLPPVAIPQIVGTDDRVAWDDPGSEIPY